jgi:shikimate kinase
MGSGKSTLGPILANVLGYRFRDLDTMIERRTGKSIARLFRDEGEQRFREIEYGMLLETIHSRRHVIALGGGAVCSDAAAGFVASSGALVYLRLPPDRLARRLKRARIRRPLLVGEDGQVLSQQELRERIERLLEARRPYYERADVIVDVNSTIGITVDAVARALTEMSQERG